jgi:pyridoxamine 5'-phosphate oxidase
MSTTPLDGAEDARDPVGWFQRSYARALAGERFDAARAALATVDALGRPEVRFVLVKAVDERGFAFYTNLESAKAKALAATAEAALAFHWESISEQVRVAGSVERVADAEADAYFAERPRGSQLAAWASRQSEPIENRGALDARFADVTRRFEGTTVPRPATWGGYRLVPRAIEFWRSGGDRMHDRWHFTREGPHWRMQRLQP